MWERLWQADLVARYVRQANAATGNTVRLVKGVRVSRPPLVGDKTEARRAAEALGLTLAGLHVHRWIIDPPISEPKDETTSSEPVSLLRDRFKVVGG
jgi:hypothetical protein